MREKSTGPRSVEGKSRARFNALKHGATARIPVLPGEDPALFHARVDAYKADLQPRSTLESELIERMALMSTQFDRATRVDAARAAENVLTIPDLTAQGREREADALGQRLFFDRRGPLASYPNKTYYRGQLRTSSSDMPLDPDNPALLVKQLESTGPGCRWLLDRWAELRARLEAGESWQSPEKLKAVRLLGRQPLDAADVREVTELFLACYVLDPRYKHPFFELRCDLDEDEFKQYDKRLQGRTPDAIQPDDATAARAMLLGLVDRAMGRLRPLAETHRVRDDMVAALGPDMVAFDDSTQGERLRRHAMACDRGLHRALASILKIHKEVETPEIDTLQPAAAAHLPAVARANDFLQNEPTGNNGQWPVVSGQTLVVECSASHDRQNEPTGDNADHSAEHQSTVDLPDRQNEPTDVEQDLQNEPTDEGVHDLRNKAVLDDRDLPEERGDSSADEKLAGKRMEWFHSPLNSSDSWGSVAEN